MFWLVENITYVYYFNNKYTWRFAQTKILYISPCKLTNNLKLLGCSQHYRLLFNFKRKQMEVRKKSKFGHNGWSGVNQHHQQLDLLIFITLLFNNYSTQLIFQSRSSIWIIHHDFRTCTYMY